MSTITRRTALAVPVTLPLLPAAAFAKETGADAELNGCTWEDRSLVSFPIAQHKAPSAPL